MPTNKQVYAATYYLEHAEKLRACTRAWRMAHPEETKAYNIRWRKEHPQAVKEADARKYAKNPIPYKERAAYRKALKYANYIERVDKRNVFKRDAGVCGECWSQGFPGVVDPSNWHLDHVQPLSKGGEHSYANTQVTHPLCNLQKGAKTWQSKD